MQWRAREIFELISAGDLTINVGAHFALADAAAAHIALESRQTTGKIVLKP
jgi:NADPH2:quinone reductase